MYTQADFIRANSAMKRFMILYLAAVLVLAAGMVACLVMRVAWLLYLLVGLITVGSIFIWDTVGIRLYSFNRFLREFRQGLEREVSGVIATIDEGETTKEGIEFRALRLFVGDDTDKQGGRLLYVDSTRFPIPAAEGQQVRCSLFGNYIKDIRVLEDQ